jgi:hypothetical protein
MTTAKREAIVHVGRGRPRGLRLHGLRRPAQRRDPVALHVLRILATALRRV